MSTVTIVDYELNNLSSVCRAIEHAGAGVVIATSPKAVLSADRLVLPGVGSFRDGMDRLRKLDLVETLQEYARTGRPLLGLCLGMQLLASEGEEFGQREGLSLIQGRVVKLPSAANSKIPHIGWNSLHPCPADRAWHGSILQDVVPESDVYFVHSYFVDMQNDANILATTHYAGIRFPSVIAAGNVFGCQFHPEKSGQTGLAIVKHFSTRT